MLVVGGWVVGGLAGGWWVLDYWELRLSSAPVAGWDETRFLGRDRDRVIRGVEFLYETKTEKFYLEDYSTRPRPRNSIYKFFVRDETETRLD